MMPVIAGLITYPQDIIKTRLQLERHARPSGLDGGFMRAKRAIVAAHGYRGLLRGMAPCLLRAVPVNAAGFLAYEQAADCLRLQQL